MGKGGLLALAAVAVLGGCGGASDEAAADEAPLSERADPPAREAAEPPGVVRSGDLESAPWWTRAATPRFECRKGAFCDDFERQGGPRLEWTLREGAGGSTALEAPSATHGANALASRGTGGASFSYLSAPRPTVGASWAGSLAFSFRVDGAPVGRVGGPELTIAGGSPASVGIALDAGGILLEQRQGTCPGAGCTSRTDRVHQGLVPHRWYHVLVGFEVGGGSGPVAAGRVEVMIDRGELIARPLAVALASGPLEVHAGLTRGDAAPFTLRVDDVMSFVLDAW